MSLISRLKTLEQQVSGQSLKDAQEALRQELATWSDKELTAASDLLKAVQADPSKMEPAWAALGQELQRKLVRAGELSKELDTSRSGAGTVKGRQYGRR